MAAIPEHLLITDRFFTIYQQQSNKIEIFLDSVKLGETHLRSSTCPLKDHMTDNIYEELIVEGIPNKLSQVPLNELLSYNIINRNYYFLEAMTSKEEFNTLISHL